MTKNNDLPYRVELTGSPAGVDYNPPEVVAMCGSMKAAEHMASFWGRQYTLIAGPIGPIPAPDYDPDDVAFGDGFKAKAESGKLHSITPEELYRSVGRSNYTGEMHPGDDTLVGDEPVSNSDKLPRLVPVERERPTLDQMPEGEPHRCMSLRGHEVIAGRVGYKACHVFEGNDVRCYMPYHGYAESYTVLDAEPKQQTVDDLRPGDAILLEESWWICNSHFNLVDLETGLIRTPRRDTPIGQVYRFEV